jgi:hypothetical protein
MGNALAAGERGTRAFQRCDCLGCKFFLLKGSVRKGRSKHSLEQADNRGKLRRRQLVDQFVSSIFGVGQLNFPILLSQSSEEAVNRLRR